MALSEGDVDGLLKGPEVEGAGIACFEWEHKDARHPRRSFAWRRRGCEPAQGEGWVKPIANITRKFGGRES